MSFWSFLFGRSSRGTYPYVDPPKKGKVSPPKKFRECPYCQETSFFEGPSGGASQNIECAQCGARFNIGLIPGGPILLDYIRKPTEEPWASRTYDSLPESEGDQ